MISVHIEPKEYWDDNTGEFIYIGPKEPKNIYLEHSLYSISKWESKYHRFYFNDTEKTTDELLDYFSMMVVGEDEGIITKEVFLTIGKEEIDKIVKYIENPMTATTFSKEDDPRVHGKSIQNENVSAELIYYWMTALNIPFECEHWHFNKLKTLIRVCAIMSDPDRHKKKKRLTSSELAARRARMEAARAKYKH